METARKKVTRRRGPGGPVSWTSRPVTRPVGDSIIAGKPKEVNRPGQTKPGPIDF